MTKPRFFATPAQLKAWFDAHHSKRGELLMGFHKRGTGKPSVTWPESVAEALCVGWIDGRRKSLGADAYTIRFTPRRPGSIWSVINIRHAKELIAEGRMRPAGLKAFEARRDDRMALYSYEQRKAPALDPALLARFRANAKAWRWFEGRAPWYRRVASHWVSSAKMEETRERRLQLLIGCCAKGEAIPVLTRPGTRRAK